MLVARVRVSTEMVEEFGKVGFTMQTFVLVGVDARVVLRCGRCARCFTLHVGVWWCTWARKKGMEKENDTVSKGEMYPDLSASPKLKLDLKLKNRVLASVICQNQKKQGDICNRYLCVYTYVCCL